MNFHENIKYLEPFALVGSHSRSKAREITLATTDGAQPMSHISTDTSWMSRGNCADRDPSIFFPSDGVGVERAKKLCEGCPSQLPCLEYALANRVDHGVWGGASERQRRRILKARRQVLLRESSLQIS
jgi:WhiB family redox-sensing transcriptional regulator